MATASRSEQVFQYDIFLNHRGPDTKEQFLVPLTKKLLEAGIERPFLDQQGIHRGERVFPVIDEARMHIAVFSSSYAQSEYCLNELRGMLRTGRHIIPVFYDVKPQHLRRPRNPRGPFEEDFRKHLELERQPPQVVEGWVAAMEEAAELLGFDRDNLKYRDNDELLMKDIVDEVVRLLSPTTITIQPCDGQYDWVQYYKLSMKGQGIVFFTANTCKNLHIAFSPEAGMVFPSYEIVIGSQDSSQHIRSEIRRLMGSETIVCAYSPMDLTNYILEEGNWHHFWICVDEVMQLIYVGQGEELDEKHAFIIFKDPSFIEKIQYFALSSNQEAITYTNIRMERTRPTLFGNFGQDSSAGLWSSIDASQVLPPSRDINSSESAHIYGDYDWSTTYKLPTSGRGIVSFSVKASANVRLAISPHPKTVDPMYEMVIFGWGNSVSSIQKNEILCRVTTIGLIQRDRENHFWVSINVDTQLIHVGRGKQPNLASIVCVYKDPNFVSEARYVSFFSSNANVIYSNIFVASPSATRMLCTQPFELPTCMRHYNWNPSYKFLSEGQGILYFTAKARNEIHVAISPKCESMDPMYEIVIGASENRRSCIRRWSQSDLISYVDEGIIDTEGLNHYWVSIDKDTKLIQVGRGNQINPNSVLFMCMDPHFLCDATYIAFSTWVSPITYSSIAVSYPSATILKSTQSIQKLSQEQIPRPNMQLQDPHFQVVISENIMGHYEWQPFFELPCMGNGVVTFAAETITAIHVAISPEPETKYPMYEIVIGGWNNTRCVIRRASQGTNIRSKQCSPISPGLNHYWVSIDASTRLIKVGCGKNPKLRSSILLEYMDLNFITGARYVAFSNWDAPVTYSKISLGTIQSPLTFRERIFELLSFVMPKWHYFIARIWNNIQG